MSPVGAFGLARRRARWSLAVVAVLIHFPGAGWSLGTFGVAFLPGVALAAVISGLGAETRLTDAVAAAALPDLRMAAHAVPGVGSFVFRRGGWRADRDADRGSGARALP